MGTSSSKGAWSNTTAATSSSDVLYAVQKGDLYRTSPVDGHYSKLSSGWGDTKCLAYNGGLLYIIYRSDGKLYLYSVDPVGDPKGRRKIQELPGSTAHCMVSRGARLYYVADQNLYIVDPVHGGAPTPLTFMWDGASCMTSLDDYLYIVADSILYRVDPDSGDPKESFRGYSNTPCMCSYDHNLYLVQNVDLYRVDGITGVQTDISKPAGTWHDSTVMTTTSNHLYIVQNTCLYSVDPNTGDWTKLS